MDLFHRYSQASNSFANPSYVEEEDEFVDEEFQEDEFVDEEFKHGDVHDDVEHEDVEDSSQGFVDWDSLPTYDIDIIDEDLVGDFCCPDKQP